MSHAIQDDNKINKDVLESLYTINKQAKEYAERATKQYRQGKKTTAKKNSNRKKALYKLKENVIKSIHSDVDRIESHQIKGDDFFCFYFDGGWSFHVPKNKIEIDDERVEECQEIVNFEKGTKKERSDKSLKDSLLSIEEKFGLNANEYLPDRYLRYGSREYFIGWKYLG